MSDLPALNIRDERSIALVLFCLSVLSSHYSIKKSYSSLPEFLALCWISRAGEHINRAGRTKWFYECFMECLSYSSSLFIQLWGLGERREAYNDHCYYNSNHATHQLEFPVFTTFWQPPLPSHPAGSFFSPSVQLTFMTLTRHLFSYPVRFIYCSLFFVLTQNSCPSSA